MSLPNYKVIYQAIAGTRNRVYMGFINNNAVEFQTRWANVADLLFVNAIPSSGNATTARTAFITALAHASNNEGVRDIVEKAFLAYLNSLTSAMPAGTFPTGVQPYLLRSIGQIAGTLSQLESNQWAIESLSKDLVNWATIYTAQPSLPAITGTTSFAHTTTSTLANAQTGGVWSSSNAAVATVNASTGVVTGVAAGTATITYTVTNQFLNANSVSTVVTLS